MPHYKLEDTERIKETKRGTYSSSLCGISSVGQTIFCNHSRWPKASSLTAVTENCSASRWPTVHFSFLSSSHAVERSSRRAPQHGRGKEKCKDWPPNLYSISYPWPNSFLSLRVGQGIWIELRDFFRPVSPRGYKRLAPRLSTYNSIFMEGTYLSLCADAPRGSLFPIIFSVPPAAVNV